MFPRRAAVAALALATLASPVFAQPKSTSLTKACGEVVTLQTHDGTTTRYALPAGGLDACDGRTPHGFIEQEAEVAAGLARFIRGGSY